MLKSYLKNVRILLKLEVRINSNVRFYDLFSCESMAYCQQKSSLRSTTKVFFTVTQLNPIYCFVRNKTVFDIYKNLKKVNLFLIFKDHFIYICIVNIFINFIRHLISQKYYRSMKYENNINLFFKNLFD